MEAITARTAAERLRVHRTTVLMWASRGWLDSDGQRRKLTIIGRDRNGATLYDWTECAVAERDTRRNKQRSHRRSRILAGATA